MISSHPLKLKNFSKKNSDLSHPSFDLRIDLLLFHSILGSSAVGKSRRMLGGERWVVDDREMSQIETLRSFSNNFPHFFPRSRECRQENESLSGIFH